MSTLKIGRSHKARKALFRRFKRDHMTDLLGQKNRVKAMMSANIVYDIVTSDL